MFKLLVDGQVVPHFLGSTLRLRDAAAVQLYIRKCNDNGDIIDEASLRHVSTSFIEQAMYSVPLSVPVLAHDGQSICRA